MKLTLLNDDKELIHLGLTGRLDIAGVEEIEMKFTAMTAPKGKPVIVDLSGVDFIASMGMRMLLSVAKAMQGRNVKLVLLNPTEMVKESLTTAGFHHVLPIFDNLEDAEAAASGK